MLAKDSLLQNRYLIGEQIGKGGMGAVYLATDKRLRCTVALKETLFDEEFLRKAFEREAQLLASLRHPALPNVIDHFVEGNGQFLVMQYIAGDDLSETLKKVGKFSFEEVYKWALQLTDVLDYLHTQDPPIIHRDIKPQNLKSTSRGQIILLDFGLAKGTSGYMTRATSSGSIFGYTPHYAPLEQIQGTGTDARSDLYSLGATLYHLLTGEKPPDALSRASAHINGEPDPLRPATEIIPNTDKLFNASLMKMMALKHDNRPKSAAELQSLLTLQSLNRTAQSSNIKKDREVLNHYDADPIPKGKRNITTVVDEPIKDKPVKKKAVELSDEIKDNKIHIPINKKIDVNEAISPEEEKAKPSAITKTLFLMASVIITYLIFTLGKFIFGTEGSMFGLGLISSTWGVIFAYVAAPTVVILFSFVLEMILDGFLIPTGDFGVMYSINLLFGLVGAIICTLIGALAAGVKGSQIGFIVGWLLGSFLSSRL